MRKIVDDNLLNAVSGGVDFLPDYEGAISGVCGKQGGSLNYRYENESAVGNYIAEHWKDKNWSSIDERETYLINGLLDAKLISPL